MTVRIRQVNPQGTRTFMGVISDGADIHASLAEAAQKLDVTTATFNLLGGIREVEFRAFDFDSQQRKAPLCFKRALEIVAGHGTIALLDGKPHVHLHLAVAYQDDQAPNGIVVLAGHAARATAFAVEFILNAYDGDPVHRAMDESTGLMLWDLPLLSPLPEGEG